MRRSNEEHVQEAPVSLALVSMDEPRLPVGSDGESRRGDGNTPGMLRHHPLFSTDAYPHGHVLDRFARIRWRFWQFLFFAVQGVFAFVIT